MSVYPPPPGYRTVPGQTCWCSDDDQAMRVAALVTAGWGQWAASRLVWGGIKPVPLPPPPVICKPCRLVPPIHSCCWGRCECPNERHHR